MDNSSKDDLLQLEKFLCFSIYSAGHAFNRVYKPLLDNLGLTYPQYLVMVTLWQEDNQSVRSIGSKLYLESSTLTPLLKRLEANGLVSRKRDPEDERSVRVSLTEAGKDLRNKAEEVPPCILDATGLDIETAKRLNRDLRTMRDQMEAGGQKV
ncbi:MAG: MarR family transcriptional regulator [Thalassospira sp.]|uniref:MarR family winged helix-turn-helix transcriptional regulator n=1 Tax=unclassified Thalassospira TaxID=2648997 RepID=UPI0007A5A4C3|nr:MULTISPECIES: MarR family transcriptional regulator [unclassified Thalassospira]KZD00361.1 MarR family transcriptional regulator [Thalassospira sp. MCCC 1A02898]MBE69579.1 MarR family transcriptional regulator [Thalassospira sp.]ONH86980.1 MarR family transcriptional regulator [Thalassospira sp. MCCC 1A02803]HAI31435.1 MarR family transcriptional regulator [Thalassospira sp.]|tara:strand:+ start:2457 stop:2915 length:459 start_codon:yes stop_codon:yes gene_type:complete